MAKLTAQDKKWRAESDARTLIEAENIRNNTGRRKAAIGKAKEMAKEALQNAKAAEKVAKTKK